MEEKIVGLLGEINEEILSYGGDNLFEEGLLDSFQVIDLIEKLEDVFDVEIDAEYVLEENFKSKDCIVNLIRKIKEIKK